MATKIFDGVIKISADIADATKNLKLIGNEVENKLTKKINSLNRTSALFTEISVKGTQALLGLGFAIGTAANAGGRFERSISGVVAAIGELRENSEEAAEKLRLVENEALRLGATTTFTASQAAEGMRLLGLAGFSASESVAAAESVLRLAEAGMLSLARAAEITANNVNAFKLSAADAARVADVLAATSANADTTIDGLGESFKFAAPVAAAMGQSIEDTAVALGVLANAGLKNTISGTALAQILGKLAKDSDKADEMLRKYGSTFEKVNPEIHSIAEIVREFSRVNVSAADILKLFEARAGRAFLSLKNQGSEAFEELTGVINDSFNEAIDQALTRMDNFMGAVRILNSALENVLIRVFNNVKDVVVDVVKEATVQLQRLGDFFSDKGNREVILFWARVAAAITLAIAAITAFATVAGLLLGLGKAVAFLVAQFQILVAIAGTSSSSILVGYAAVGVKLLLIVAAITAVVKAVERLSTVIDSGGQSASQAFQPLLDAFLELNELLSEIFAELLLLTAQILKSFVDLAAGLSGPLSAFSSFLHELNAVNEATDGWLVKVAALTVAVGGLAKGLLAAGAAISSFSLGATLPALLGAETGDLQQLVKGRATLASGAIDGVETNIEHTRGPVARFFENMRKRGETSVQQDEAFRESVRPQLTERHKRETRLKDRLRKLLAVASPEDIRSAKQRVVVGGEGGSRAGSQPKRTKMAKKILSARAQLDALPSNTEIIEEGKKRSLKVSRATPKRRVSTTLKGMRKAVPEFFTKTMPDMASKGLKKVKSLFSKTGKALTTPFKKGFKDFLTKQLPAMFGKSITKIAKLPIMLLGLFKTLGTGLLKLFTAILTGTKVAAMAAFAKLLLIAAVIGGVVVGLKKLWDWFTSSETQLESWTSKMLEASKTTEHFSKAVDSVETSLGSLDERLNKIASSARRAAGILQKDFSSMTQLELKNLTEEFDALADPEALAQGSEALAQLTKATIDDEIQTLENFKKRIQDERPASKGKADALAGLDRRITALKARKRDTTGTSAETFEGMTLQKRMEEAEKQEARLAAAKASALIVQGEQALARGDEELAEDYEQQFKDIKDRALKTFSDETFQKGFMQDAFGRSGLGEDAKFADMSELAAEAEAVDSSFDRISSKLQGLGADAEPFLQNLQKITAAQAEQVKQLKALEDAEKLLSAGRDRYGKRNLTRYQKEMAAVKELETALSQATIAEQQRHDARIKELKASKDNVDQEIERAKERYRQEVNPQASEAELENNLPTNLKDRRAALREQFDQENRQYTEKQNKQNELGRELFKGRQEDERKFRQKQVTEIEKREIEQLKRQNKHVQAAEIEKRHLMQETNEFIQQEGTVAEGTGTLTDEEASQLRNFARKQGDELVKEARKTEEKKANDRKNYLRDQQKEALKASGKIVAAQELENQTILQNERAKMDELQLSDAERAQAEMALQQKLAQNLKDAREKERKEEQSAAQQREHEILDTAIKKIGEQAKSLFDLVKLNGTLLRIEMARAKFEEAMEDRKVKRLKEQILLVQRLIAQERRQSQAAVVDQEALARTRANLAIAQRLIAPRAAAAGVVTGEADSLPTGTSSSTLNIVAAITDSTRAMLTAGFYPIQMQLQGLGAGITPPPGDGGGRRFNNENPPQLAGFRQDVEQNFTFNVNNQLDQARLLAAIRSVVEQA